MSPTRSRVLVRGRRTATLGLVLALGVAACGGGEDESALTPLASTAPTTTTTSNPVSTTTTAPSDTTLPPDDPLVIDGLDQVGSGLVRITASGGLRDPLAGSTRLTGAATGFFVSRDGLAVTAYHPIAGASQLEVELAGVSVAARIVGVSPCDGVALLAVESDEPVAHFRWSTLPPDVGTEVYAAGFTEGSSEAVLARGRVLTTQGAGNRFPAVVVESTIVHDARVAFGAAGGPLVTREGEVVGLNLSSLVNPLDSMAGSTALRSRTVEDLAAILGSGDVDSVGVNLWPWYAMTSGVTGLWVAGVMPASPAQRLGLEPGDLIVTMDGLEVGRSGDVAAACAIVRGAPSSGIEVEVLRLDTSEFLRGRLGGDAGLQLEFSFSEDLGDDLAEDADPYATVVRVVDEAGLLAVEVPTAWSELATGVDQLTDLGSPSAAIAASSDLESFLTTIRQATVGAVPGVLVTAVEASTVATSDLLDEVAPPPGACATVDTYDYDDGVFEGSYRLWSQCGDSPTILVRLVARPTGPGAPIREEDWTVTVTVLAVTTADLDALDTVWATFELLA